MKFTDRVRAFFAPSPDTQDFAAMGRPQKIEGEAMVLGNDLLASMTSIKDGGIYFQPTDEVIRTKGWRTYKEMVHDDQIKSCLEFKKILVAGRAWELSPGDETPEAKAQADFVLENFSRLNIENCMKDALTALEFGFSIAEQVFERDQWNGKQYVFLKKLAHREPSQIYIKSDQHGNFLGAKQYNATYPASQGDIVLPAEKLWLFTHDKNFGNLYGNSDLRSAYRSWLAKKFIVQFWNVFLERMGSPMTTMMYPQGASSDMKNMLKKIMRNLSSKTEIMIPEGVKIDLVEAKRGGQAGYADALDFHNNSIARALLMPGLFGMNGAQNRQAQGNSQGFIQLRLLFKTADTISQLLQKSLMEQVVRPLLDLNFAKPIYPEFVWQDYGQFEGQVVADEIRQLHAAGIIDMDQADVNYVRSIMGLPLRDPDDKPDDVIRPEPLPPPASGAPPPPANQGNNRAGDAPGVKENSEQRVSLVLAEFTDD